MEYTCIARYRDCTGTVVRYDMFCHNNGQNMSFTSLELKALMKNGKATVSNLKINASGALMLIKKKGMDKPKDIWPPAR